VTPPSIPPAVVVYMACFPEYPPSETYTISPLTAATGCSVCGRSVPVVPICSGRVCQRCAVHAVRAFEEARREIEEEPDKP